VLAAWRARVAQGGLRWAAPPIPFRYGAVARTEHSLYALRPAAAHGGTAATGLGPRDGGGGKDLRSMLNSLRTRKREFSVELWGRGGAAGQPWRLFGDRFAGADKR
jgi:hypothetical protein